MNIFDIKKRRTWSYEEWMRNRKVAETPNHIEKGNKNDVTKAGMDDKGVETPSKNAALTDDNINLEKGNKSAAAKATYGKTDNPDKSAAMTDPKEIKVTQGVK